jgi:predicted transcriptional regulator
MSSKNVKKLESPDFIDRFVEICGSSQPAEIARLLNISYQAAKNYLQGRLPDSAVLKTISEKTQYSINWLLTGQGKKFIESSLNEDTLQVSDQIRAFVRKECLEVISELLENQKENQNKTAPAKVIVLTSENIKEEKVMDESGILSGKKQ